MDAVARHRRNTCDSFISIGGGPVHDTGKGARVPVAHDGRHRLQRPTSPTTACPRACSSCPASTSRAARGPRRGREDRAGQTLALATGRRLVRRQCYEGPDETKALHDRDHGKLLLSTQILRDKVAELLEARRPAPTRSTRAAAGAAVDFTVSVPGIGTVPPRSAEQSGQHPGGVGGPGQRCPPRPRPPGQLLGLVAVAGGCDDEQLGQRAGRRHRVLLVGLPAV